MTSATTCKQCGGVFGQDGCEKATGGALCTRCRKVENAIYAQKYHDKGYVPYRQAERNAVGPDEVAAERAVLDAEKRRGVSDYPHTCEFCDHDCELDRTKSGCEQWEPRYKEGRFVTE